MVVVLPIGRRGAERVRLARARLIHRRGRVGARPPALRATAAVRGTEAHAGVYLAGEQRTGSIPGEHPINFTSYYSTPLYYTYTKNLRICFALHLADYCLGDTKKKKTAVGSGTAPDNEVWVQRKRSTVLRFGTSTWFMHCKFAGDEEAFRLKYGMSPDKAGEYAIHGGGVPIRVKGVEGVVAVVVVSGLKQHEDHGVIFDVVRENWQ